MVQILPPLDFRVYPEIEAALRDVGFEDASELHMYTQNVVSSYDSDWFSDTYAILLQRHRKCIKFCGCDVEKCD